uniref:Uncharacterized protein n=1 Tax=Lepeophtheirus salmonis TaxID=72036 RepID=A0A0K2UXW4_LEPSM
MAPYFFGSYKTINVRFLRYIILLWIKPTYSDVWMQDDAPVHTSVKKQKFCEDHMGNIRPKDICLPSSPYIHPLEFL